LQVFFLFSADFQIGNVAPAEAADFFNIEVTGLVVPQFGWAIGLNFCT
jgi:hypothetical protein